MKKVFSMLLFVCIFAFTSTVRATHDHDVGPPIPKIEKLYADHFKAVSNVAAVNTPIAPLFADVGCRNVITITAIAKNENVKTASVQLTSQYAELTGSTTLRRPINKYASPWNSFYRSTISKRQNDVIRPPDNINLTT